MDAVREWAIGLCAAAVAVAAMQGLIPKKGSGATFRVLLTAFFLCVFTAPLLNFQGIGQLHLSALPAEVQNDLLEETVERQLRQQVSAAVEEIVGGVLAGYNVSADKVETTMDIEDDGGIYIVNVRVTFSGQVGGAATLRRRLEERLGVPVFVVTEGSG